jgi:hypothetical protein
MPADDLSPRECSYYLTPADHHVKDAHLREVYAPPPATRAAALIKSTDEYHRLHAQSLEDPEGFWGRVADGFHW